MRLDPLKPLIMVLMILAGCSELNSDSELIFANEIRVVQGSVALLDENGRPVEYGGPVKLRIDSNTYITRVSGAAVDLIVSSLPELKMRLYKRCIADGWTPARSNGFAVFLKESEVWLVEHCVPEGVVLPPFSKVGDRVPRIQ